ncbi:MAG: LacI family DNA-binding transcriptional regulator [Chloroflexota bacterium]
MQVTLKDIAEQSGFSVTTVSRALGGYDDVSAQTRTHILKIASELGYQPNQIARQLRSQQTRTIGLIIPAASSGLEDDFFGLLLKGVTHAATRQHYDVLVSAQFSEKDEMDAYYRIVGGRRVDGVILARTYRDDPRIDYLRSIDHPFVVSGRASLDQKTDFPYIDADSRYGVRSLVEHLASYGHQHIGLILSPESIVFTSYRFDGYREGLANAGLAFDPAYVATGDLSEESGRHAAETLLARAPRLTAIVACNDLMALGAMAAIKARGLTVGDGVAIGGFDDIPLARHADPPLTTVRQPIYEIGEQLADMLIHIIANEPLKMLGRLLKPRLIVRASSGSPRNG